MVVNELGGSKRFQPLIQQREGTTQSPFAKSDTFVDTLNEFVGDVNSLKKESAEQTARMLRGESVDIHDVMITAEKAKTSFDLLMELRNKGLDLYREVMRIQV